MLKKVNKIQVHIPNNFQAINPWYNNKINFKNKVSKSKQNFNNLKFLCHLLTINKDSLY